MYRRIAEVFAAFFLAIGILFISTFRSANIRYAFNQPSQIPTPEPRTENIDYRLAYPGLIGPGDALWPAKAVRDRLIVYTSVSSASRADRLLLLADKRLAMSQKLFEQGDPEIAVSTLTKAEKYLERAVQEEKTARLSGENTIELLGRLSLATLKHRQVIEEEILPKAPEDARPIIVKTLDYPKHLYMETRDATMSVGRQAPEYPEGQ